MPDVDRLVEKAEKYLQKQKYESALETYQQINKLEPGNEDVLVLLGDLSLKLKRNAEGLRYLSQLVDHYVKRSEAVKAIVICRKILKLSPQDVATLSRLGSLLEMTHKSSEALEAHRAALELHRKSGGPQQVFECLERIVALEPENLESQTELAEAAAKAGKVTVATPAFLKAAELARKAGLEDRWAECIERAHTLDPKDESASIAVSEGYLKRERAQDAIKLLEPINGARVDDLRVLELLARAYLAVHDYTKAQPLCWKLYQARPETIEMLQMLMEGMVQSGSTDQALALVGQVKGAFFQQGKKNEFLKIVEKIYEADESSLSVLEVLSHLYDELNKEDGLRRSLTRLFNLYLGAEQFQKAADTLEKIIDVDPYGEGHNDRLLNLEGNIDNIWYQNIASRLQIPSPNRPAPGEAGAAAAEEAEGLDALILDGELSFQYQLNSKLNETLGKINRLFPGAEEKNARLRELYQAAGFHPAGAAAPTDISERGIPVAAPPAPTPKAASSRESLEELKRISDLTASIYRESTPEGVMQVAVNEIGRAMSASRCWGALGTPDHSPALTVEYCSPADSASDVAAALKLYSTLIRDAAAKPDGWLMEDATQFSALAGIQQEIQKLAIKSILAFPLMDNDEPSGLLIVEQCDRRRAWNAEESVLLNTLSTQISIAVKNTKLRRLVRSLAGSEEETGLLPRSSYLDCLLSEVSRAKENSAALSVCLMEPENPSALIKSVGDVGVQRYIQQVAKVLQSNLRQNDIAIRYAPCAIAAVLPNTPLPQGGLAVEKLRRLIGQVKLDSKNPPNFCAAVCDVPVGGNFNAVDGVTEVINRLEATLDQARKEGGKRVILSSFGG